MRISHCILIITIVVSLFTFTGCPEADPGFIDSSAQSTYSGIGDEVFHINTSTDVNLTHTLHLGASIADVYYVFTNTKPYSHADHPVISSKSSVNKTRESLTGTQSEYSGLGGRKGKPEISAYNKDVSDFLGTGTAKGISPEEPQKDTVGGPSVSFKYDLDSHTIQATCRAIVTDGIKTLNIYVADDSWETGGTKTYNVTQTMVNEMAARFLQSDPDNDIYDWVTGIYGPEWGSHPYPGDLIAANNTITILLFDIEGDDVPRGPFFMGYFWAKDNFRTASVPGSNERIMFYIDSVMYAYPDGGTWNITDYWPMEMISTLAHEFQHMIHFYQKAILPGNRGYNSETWLNEMCSMVAEDFVSDKILTDGPRGVPYDEPSAGSPGNTNGRLPLFNNINDYSLTSWNDSLYNYSTVYAFGGYMARNFGGVELFREIVQSGLLNYQVINEALLSLGYTGEDFSSLLTKWGAAILLSDNYSQDLRYYKYNTNAYATTISSGINYNLGSINLYNYNYSTQRGPYIYTSSPVGFGRHDSFESASNRLYRVGEGLTGDVVETIQMEQGVKLTVVVKSRS
ncbi:MAG: peptidase M30 [Spirochaetales bacterium]|nr:peptidase M30 [Spirochaetales bacterium]